MLLKQGFFEFERRKKFMAFFSNGEDKLKLMILFTLECAEMPLSREQIATVMSENGVENYFDVCEHIIDLEANGCIASVPTFKMQMIVMTCLSVMVIMEITKNSKNTAINNLQTIVQERSQIVDNYVQESEVILSAYSKAGEILNVLKNPENKSALDAAQKYTESFSKDINNLEGLYVSEWNTHVLAHTNAKVVGITTREGDSLKALQDKLIATDGVYNTGIIIWTTG